MTGSKVPVAYRSTSTEVLARWREAQEASDTYWEGIHQLLDDYGAGGYKFFRDHGRNTFSGLLIPPGEDPPRGWRYEDEGAGRAVPDKRVREGKAIAKLLDAIERPVMPPALPGMPRHYLKGRRFYTPGLQLLEDGTALYAVWTVEPVTIDRNDGDDIHGRQDGVDESSWLRVKASEYYAALEAGSAAGHE